ncbi:glycosyltransferase [Caballeronia sp. LjRoot34]|uniref:glycosyltransferase n=1 Tax=Caballeronia sp. LjRoot34 TaxID=3342325 RepID=UPI003ECDF4DC
MSTVSVLIAVYAKDDPELFRDSLRSNVLDQTDMPDQLVVVVDGPVGDAINNVLEDARIAFDACRGPDFMTVLRLPENRGVAAAMNRGIPSCRCELIARADADDISYPDRFRLQKAVLAEHPDVDVVTAWQHDFSLDEKKIVAVNQCPEYSEQINALLQLRNPVCQPSMMIRAKVFRLHGTYDETVPLLEDYELHLRWTSQGVRYRCIQEPLVRVSVSSALYQRRGGLAYARREFAFRMNAVKRGLLSGGPRFYFVATLYLLFRSVPAGVRRRLYVLVRARANEEVVL